jgi:predicted membrane protein
MTFGNGEAEGLKFLSLFLDLFLILILRFDLFQLPLCFSAVGYARR